MCDQFRNTYCTINGLQTEAGKLLNGQECFVCKPDVAHNGRRCVLLRKDMGTAKSKFMSLKGDNLTKKTHIVVGGDSNPLPITSDANQQQERSKVKVGVFAAKAFKQGEIILKEKTLVPIFRHRLIVPYVKDTPLLDHSKISKSIHCNADGPKTVSPPFSEDVIEVILSQHVFRGVSDDVKELVLSSNSSLIDFPSSSSSSSASAASKAGDGLSVSEQWARVVANTTIVPGSVDNTASIFPCVSKMNHGCFGRSYCGGANVWLFADSTENENAIVVTAARDIEQGEELLMDYLWGVPRSECFSSQRRMALSYLMKGADGPCCNTAGEKKDANKTLKNETGETAVDGDDAFSNFDKSACLYCHPQTDKLMTNVDAVERKIEQTGRELLDASQRGIGGRSPQFYSQTKAKLLSQLDELAAAYDRMKQFRSTVGSTNPSTQKASPPLQPCPELDFKFRIGVLERKELVLRYILNASAAYFSARSQGITKAHVLDNFKALKACVAEFYEARTNFCGAKHPMTVLLGAQKQDMLEDVNAQLKELLEICR